jgi:hypothetical protein
VAIRSIEWSELFDDSPIDDASMAAVIMLYAATER